MAVTQANREIEVITPQGKDVLLLQDMSVTNVVQHKYCLYKCNQLFLKMVENKKFVFNLQ